MSTLALMVAALCYALTSIDYWVMKGARPWFGAAIFCYCLANIFLVMDAHDMESR